MSVMQRVARARMRQLRVVAIAGERFHYIVYQFATWLPWTYGLA